VRDIFNERYEKMHISSIRAALRGIWASDRLQEVVNYLASRTSTPKNVRHALPATQVNDSSAAQKAARLGAPGCPQHLDFV
jgi:hypothetical protein